MFKSILNYLNSKQFTVIVISIIIAIFFFQSENEYGYITKNSKKTFLEADGTGYYAYLPQYIVYPRDTNFRFHHQIRKKYKETRFFEMLGPFESGLNNKYYIGTPVLQAPFYWVAHIIHNNNTWDADGYSLGYRFSIQIAALFYWLIGVIALFALFMKLKFSRISILFAIIIVSFGTNLNYYVVYYPAMSHVYSFSIISIFLYFSKRWADENLNKYLYFSFFLLGLIVILRPINGLILLIVPFLFDSFSAFVQRLKDLVLKKTLRLSTGIILFLIPILVQLLEHYHQYGSITLNNYSKEGFSNLWTPQIWNVLFSFHKGFFIYAPVMLLLFFCLYQFWRNSSRYFFIGWSMVVIVWLYAISSWWCWDYGGGLGMRAMIEFLPLFMFPMLYAFKFGKKYFKVFLFIISVVGIYLYQMFQIQYTRQIISCCEMDQAKFWNVFHKTDERFRWTLDYDNAREKLPNKILESKWSTHFYSSTGWRIIDNKLSQKVECTIYESSYFLLYYPIKEDVFLGKLVGEVKINNAQCNPALSIRYSGNGEIIDQSFFPYGNLVNNENKFEYFEIEINHQLFSKTHNKKIDRIEMTFNNVNCPIEYRNVRFISY